MINIFLKIFQINFQKKNFLKLNYKNNFNNFNLVSANNNLKNYQHTSFNNYLLVSYNLNNHQYYYSIKILRVFKRFCNFFYNALVYNYNFILLDYNQHYSDIFKNLLYPHSFNYKNKLFFNFNNKFLKNPNYLSQYYNFIVNGKIKMALILDYNYFHNYITFFNVNNVYTFSFVPNAYDSNKLDFFLILNTKFDFLEKYFYVMHVYGLYSLYFYQKKLLIKKTFLCFFKKVNFYKYLV